MKYLFENQNEALGQPPMFVMYNTDYYVCDPESQDPFVIHGGRFGLYTGTTITTYVPSVMAGIARRQVNAFGGTAGGSRIERLFLSRWRRS